VGDTASVSSGVEAAADAGVAGRPVLRLRSRRRRRRRPAAPGLLPGPTPDVAGPAESEQAGGEASAAASAVAVPGQRSFRAPRRRLRHPPLSAAAPAAAEAEGKTPAAAAPGAEPAPRSRNRRRRRAAPVPAAATEHAAGAPETRGPRGEHRDHRERRPRDGPSGRFRPDGRGGRDGPRQVDRKLYTVDAVVDRGFDDVEEEAGTRRVHWTIVKRTTADQVSRKALSAVYVLQRDGADSEFPSLGAARNAVNKTIVHPEKLTRSKAEYAAERGGGKK